MTVKECYDNMKANYDEAFSRLRSDDRIKKFLLKVLNDPSYDLLIESMQNKKVEEAFRAAHTIKGICLNLAITGLGYSASVLTEALRGRKEYGADLEPLLQKVKKDYSLTTVCIKMLEE